MFKIESYITPFILNHVAKYVKNIRPQDAQVYLWGGEVAFQNLDLRLDILQAEINLPFEFLSGHIHELIIHVPWTKITREPIVITINTIEFILKLKDLKSTADIKSKKISKIDDMQYGYMPSLVSKIINNITINCNNIILKYVEEDIVMSMNIQLLSFCSSDELWNPSFIDIGQMKGTMRKLVEISDLTICLDKRNSVGQIDLSQEPVLYRCSLQIRIMTKFKSNTLLKTSSSRIDVYTKFIDINVSLKQFPMILRLMELIIVLKSENFNKYTQIETTNDSTENSRSIDNNISYLSWVWNLLPKLFTDEIITESEVIEPNYLTNNLYITKLKLTLKSCEELVDSFVPTAHRIRYDPILYVFLESIHCNTVISGVHWFNMRTRIAKIEISPPYKKESSDKFFCKLYFESETNVKETFSKDSLFGSESNDDIGKNDLPITDWEIYLKKYTNEYFQNCCSALVIDLIYLNSSYESQENRLEPDIYNGSNDLSEKSLIRIYTCSVVVNYNSFFVAIIKTLKELIDKYDYPPYVEVKIDSIEKISPTSLVDYDLLMSKIPTKIINIYMKNFTVFISLPIDVTSINDQVLTSIQKEKLPSLRMCFNEIQCKYWAPIQVEKLVYTICQLPKKPDMLLQTCYNLYDLNFEEGNLDIVSNSMESFILLISKTSANLKLLLLPHLWSDINIIKRKFEISTQNIKVSVNKSQQKVLFKFISNFIYNKPICFTKTMQSSIINNRLHDKKASHLNFFFEGINLTAARFNELYLYKGCLKSMKIFVSKINITLRENSPKNKVNLILCAPKLNKTYSENVLQYTVQLPVNYKSFSHPLAVIVEICSFLVVLDPVLLEYMESFKDEVSFCKLEKDDCLSCNETETKSSRKSVSDRKFTKIKQPEETVHHLSEKEEKLKLPSKLQAEEPILNFFKFLQLSNFLALNILVDGSSFLIPQKSIFVSLEDSFSLKDELEETEHAILEYSCIKIRSSSNVDMYEIFKKSSMKLLQVTGKNSFPWNCTLEELKFFTKFKQYFKNCLFPFKVSLTFAIDMKKDKNTTITAFNLHIDTTPIVLDISIKEILYLQNIWRLVSRSLRFMQISGHPKESTQTDARILTNADDDEQIKEFLATKSSSEISMTSKRQIEEEITSVTSFWFQCTTTRLTVSIMNADENATSKIDFYFEDFITSFDRQNIYFKLKSKIGALHIQLYEFKKNEWEPDASFKLCGRTGSIESKCSNTFIELTVTIADTGNIFKKWGTQKQLENLNHSLAEVMISMQALDVMFNIKHLKKFLPVITNIYNFEIWNSRQRCTIATVAGLPLIYADFKGFTLYVPVPNAKIGCDVFILKVGTMTISPVVKNPLNRTRIHPEIYTKAAQMQILNIPGSEVEDRQYELNVSSVSAVTGNWNEVLNYIKDNSTKFYNMNPAFEWNNQSKKALIIFDKVFSDFAVSVTYAPYMTFKCILICGQSLEFNCIADLVVDITTDTLTMFSLFLKECNDLKIATEQMLSSIAKNVNTINNINGKIEKANENITPSTSFSGMIRVNKKKRGQHISAVKSLVEALPLKNVSVESGVESFEKNPNILDSRKSFKDRPNHDAQNIPFDISLVAGIFIFKLYYNHTFKENNKTEKLSLITATLTQPSVLISQKIYKKTTKLSIFNIDVSCGNMKNSESNDFTDFEDKLLETSPGPLSLTGVPPPLIFFKYKTSLSNQPIVEIDIEREIFIYMSHKMLKKLYNYHNIITRAIKIIPMSKQVHLKDQKKASTIKLLQSCFSNACNINITLCHMCLNCKEDNFYNIKILFEILKMSFNICEPPHKVIFSFVQNSFKITVDKTAILHPMNLKFIGVITKETWDRVPFVFFKAESDVVQFDIGLKKVKCLETMIKKMTSAVYNTQITVSDKNAKVVVNPVDFERLSLISGKIHFKKNKKNKVEYYQDDLRAGAFQYIEAFNDGNLPLPYQIKVMIDRDGLICWRYPHPRIITKLHIFPIPMQITKSSKCRLEYYSESYVDFVPLLEFFLSDNETQLVDLKTKKITAHTWRVVIMHSVIPINREYFTVENITMTKVNIEDELKKENSGKQVLECNPKFLVGCLRVDSCFDPSLIPKVDVLLKVGQVKINFQNEYEDVSENKHYFKNFKLLEGRIRYHTFALIVISNIEMLIRYTSSKKCFVTTEQMCLFRVLDYNTLNMISVVEDAIVKASFEYDENIDITFLSEILKINFGPTIIKTLLYSQKQWMNSSNDNFHGEFLVSKILICNCSNFKVKFKQNNYKEEIVVNENECKPYIFQNEHVDPKLVFSIEDEKNGSSKPTKVQKEGTHYIRVGKNILIAESKQFSENQNVVILKGMVEILSMTQTIFMSQLKNKTNMAHILEFEIPSYGHTSLNVNSSRLSNFVLRLKIQNSMPGCWSGEIPLKQTVQNTPWLVKVPRVKSSTNFISFWVRVFQEDIVQLSTADFIPRRILVVIWPMFVVRSLFPDPIVLKDSETQQIYSIPGRGAIEEIQMCATHETDHTLFIKELSGNKIIFENIPIVLSYRTINWKTFFFVSEKFSKISQILETLTNTKEIKWPFVKENIFWEKERTFIDCNPICKFQPSRELSCSLMLDITCNYLILNSLSREIKISFADDSNFLLLSNEIAFSLFEKKYFTIGMNDGSTWITSKPIFFEKTSSLMNENYYFFTESKKTLVQVQHPSYVWKFYLNSFFEDGKRIIIISPVYIVTNFTGYNVTCYPFIIEKKQKTDYMTLLNYLKQRSIQIPPQYKINTNAKGKSTDIFYYLNSKRNISSEHNYKDLIIFTLDNKSISYPVQVDRSFNRKCFNLSNGESNTALAMCNIRNNGQYFINIYEDSCVLLEILNSLDTPLFVSQINMIGREDNSYVFCEGDIDVQWHQILLPNKITFYTPSRKYELFPEFENKPCYIVFAKIKEPKNMNVKQDIKWSKPLCVERKKEDSIIYIPMYGNIKVNVNYKQKTIRISLNLITKQTEFYVKDLRTRLLKPILDTGSENEINSFQTMDDLLENTKVYKQHQANKENICCKSKQTVGHCRTIIEMKKINMHIFIKEVIITALSRSKSQKYKTSEICSIYIDDFLYEFNAIENSMNIFLTNFQIDNKLYSNGQYDFPVLLCSQVLNEKKFEMPSIPNLQVIIKDLKKISLIHIMLQLHESSYDLKSLNCQINPLRIYIEDKYLNNLFDYTTEFDNEISFCFYESKLKWRTCTAGNYLLPLNVVKQVIYLSEPLQLQSIRIEPINILLSVHTSIKLFIALDHSPLNFSTFERQNILTLTPRLGYLIGKYYLSAALFGAGWVVGSLEILGSPSCLARSVTMGLRDFFSMPAEGLLRGPWGFIIGLTQGSVSLLKNITAGTVNSVTKLAASVARNLDRLTLDNEHFLRTEELRRCRPQGFTEGFSQGLTGLGISILGALGGLARHPLEARSTVQVMTGVGKGIVGAFTKPISGAAELLALTGQGVLHTVGFNLMPKQRNTLGLIISHQAYPASEKIWMLLPVDKAGSHILFYNEGTLICDGHYKLVTICLTDTLLAIFDIENGELCDIMALHTIKASINMNDPSLVNIRTLFNEKDESRESEIIHLRTRIFSFIRNSNDQIPMVNNFANDNFFGEAAKKEESYENHCLINMNSYLAKHLVNYINSITIKNLKN